MIVAFLNEQPTGITLEPPLNPHVTVKKKFKLIKTTEQELVELLTYNINRLGSRVVITDKSQEYDSSENMILTLKNEDIWTKLHMHFLEVLSPISISRDPQFEGQNYLPHITWKLRGDVNLDPAKLKNKTFEVEYLYLIKRIHPTKSVAKIVAKISLNSNIA